MKQFQESLKIKAKMPDKITAAIDIGTNSFHLVVARTNGEGIIKILSRDKEVVRLGKSSSDMKYLTTDAMERGISALKRFRLACDSYGAQIRAVATSAVREALNKEEFITRVKEQTGIQIEVVSGFEEARLIYLGVLQALPVFEKRILLIDIGGGSTEFLTGYRGSVEYANSVKIGSVRLTEKYFTDRKISNENIEMARIHARSIINPVVRQLKEKTYEIVIGSSGTILNIGSIIYAMNNGSNIESFNFNNYRYSDGELDKALKAIFKCDSAAQLKKIEGLDNTRADIITAGGIILEQIFSELNLKEITLSTYALREGILLDTIDKEHSTLDSEDMKNIRYRSIMNLAKHCGYDEFHSRNVLRFSNKIFDSIRAVKGLEDTDKEYLEAAAILHDIGHSISHAQHHRHSYYLIRNSELLGFNDEEIEIIANIARYHRKSHPKIKHPEFLKLTETDQKKVRILAGILRIADGLDRGHSGTISDIETAMSNGNFIITITPSGGRDTTLEVWGANMRKNLFEEEFDCRVIIGQ